MNQAVYFSTRVLNTLNSLPIDERSTMAAALTSEFMLGIDLTDELTDIQQVVYSILRFYVKQDQNRLGAVHPVVDIRDLN